MTYQQTLDFLFSQLPAYHRIGKAAYKNDLCNTISLDNYFENPHLKYPTIHIGGTNGKGSVSHMIASIFQEAGYKTGLYTSPHLKDFRERIRVDGEMISKKEVVEFIEVHKGIIESLKPSFFEMTVALAFKYFAEKGVDIAIIEVGMGGRLDSTNIINPVLSVITNIGHDHMDLLGSTLEMIATEKAGIIKKNVPVVISETHPVTKEIFIRKAIESDSQISFADERYLFRKDNIKSQKAEGRYMVTDLVTKKKFIGKTVLRGEYQSRNIKAVFCVINSLPGAFKFSDKNISDGIRKVVQNTGLLGRWQVIGLKPLVICDTGHNKEGLEFVMTQIQEIPKDRLHLIIGFVSDKDLKSVLTLFPKDATYYFTKASIPRALNEVTLMEEALRYGLVGKNYPDVKNALYNARKNATQSDLIFIGGSTFVVAEVI